MDHFMKRKFGIFAALSFCAFIVYAFYFNSFGADATVMMDFFKVDASQQGFVITIQAIGGLIAALFLALQGERFNKIKVISFGLLLLAAASVLIGVMPAYLRPGSGYYLLLVFAVIGGIGFTAIDVMMNGVITEVYPDKKNTLLPMTHACYGAGTMVAPFFVSMIVNPALCSSFATPYMIVGIASIAVLLLYSLIGRQITPHTPYADMTEMKKRVSENPAEIFKTKTAWLFLLAGFVYFIFQIGIASWFPTYGHQELGIDYSLSGLMSTAFFGGALVIRFLLPLVLKKLPPEKYYVRCGLIAGACMIAAFLIDIVPIVIALSVVGGFLQGGLVVTLVMMCCDAFPTRTASASAIVVFAVNAGSLVGPFVMGKIAETMGSFRVPMLIITGCLILSSLIILYYARTNQSRREQTV